LHLRSQDRAVNIVNSAVIADSRHAYALPYIGFGLQCKRESTRKLFVTDDGGRSWARRRTPFNIAALAADGRRVAVVGVGASCANVLALSDDNAHTWRIRQLPRKGCSVSLAGDGLWLGCGRLLLVSADRGRTWARLEGPKRLDTSRISAAGRGAAWGLFWRRREGVRLWHTADAGRTWLEQWPRLPTP